TTTLTTIEQPTTTDILTTTTQPAGPRFDILFLIDVSKQAKGRLEDIKGFVSKLMSGYGVSQQNARVALMAVGSAQMGSIPFANFDTIDSYENLLNYIEMVKKYTDFEHNGQAIEHALNIAVADDFMRTGYRTELENHVIVYVTTTTKRMPHLATTSLRICPQVVNRSGLQLPLSGQKHRQLKLRR
ncbi:von Willebrand factor type A domain protein, partial [Ostertagia ostertagi]